MHVPPINPQIFDFRGFNFPFDARETQPRNLGRRTDNAARKLFRRQAGQGSSGARSGGRQSCRESGAEGRRRHRGCGWEERGHGYGTAAGTRDQTLKKKKRKVNLTVVRDRHEQTVPVELERLGPGERGKMAANFGIDAGELQRFAAEAKAQLAAAQLALQESQRLLSDQQRQALEKARRAAEEYQRAIQEQLKLQLQKQLHPLAGQNEAI